MINFQYFPKNRVLPEHLRQVVDIFIQQNAKIDSERTHLKSNEVLAVIAPFLKSLGFKTEPLDGMIEVPVLFGRNGIIDKYFAADGYNPNTKTVIEIEAGRALTNNQFLKDLFEACIMNEAEYLVIAVRNTYRNSPDFDKIFQFFETMFLSERLKLPLTGLMLIGY